MARWHRTSIAVASRLWSGHGFCRFDHRHTSEDGVCGGPGTFSGPLGAITRGLVPAWSPLIRRSADRCQVGESAAYSQSAWAMVLQAAAPKTLAAVGISLVLMFTDLGVRAAELDAYSLRERADFFGETAADTRADPITAALAAYTRHIFRTAAYLRECADHLAILAAASKLLGELTGEIAAQDAARAAQSAAEESARAAGYATMLPDLAANPVALTYFAAFFPDSTGSDIADTLSSISTSASMDSEAATTYSEFSTVLVDDGANLSEDWVRGARTITSRFATNLTGLANSTGGFVGQAWMARLSELDASEGDVP